MPDASKSSRGVDDQTRTGAIAVRENLRYIDRLDTRYRFSVSVEQPIIEETFAYTLQDYAMIVHTAEEPGLT